MIQKGALLLAKGYGMADLENAVPNALHTKFRIGSTTKMFTSMAVMMLAEQGKLQVEDLLSRYREDIADHWSKITLHHLLSNSSGIVHSWPLPGFAEQMSLRVTTTETIQKICWSTSTGAAGRGIPLQRAGVFLVVSGDRESFGTVV